MAIDKCECKHEFQDEKYGKGNRVFTTRKVTDKCSCTVCGRDHPKKKDNAIKK